MKKIIYLAVILLISFACKKDDDSITKLSKIDTIIESYKNMQGYIGDTITHKYSYNNKGDISEINTSYLKSGHTAKTEYKYINSSLIIKIYKNSVHPTPMISDTTYINLDSKGLAIQEYFFMSTYLGNRYYFYEFKYDVDNRRIESKQYSPATSLTDYSRLVIGASNIIVDGNIITTTITHFTNGQPDNPAAWEYTYFEENKNTIGNANTGMSFYGESNVNPIKEKFTTSRTGYTYEYDNQNRIVKQTVHQASSVSQNYIYYTYTYK